MSQRRLHRGQALFLSLLCTMALTFEPWCKTRNGPGVAHAGDVGQDSVQDKIHTGYARAVPFARGGPLKMLYDNRMHPQAIEFDGSVYLTWRGPKGMPYIRSYDLDSRQFSEPVMMLAGMEDKIDAAKYASDHHYSPVIWMDAENRFHVLSGCHGISDESKQDMGRYGWGDRVELWVSDPRGENWKLAKDLTPKPGHRWQNIKFVSHGNGQHVPNMLLFYGWKGADGKGTAYLWDNRKLAE